jgi:hypothetical protein
MNSNDEEEEVWVVNTKYIVKPGNGNVEAEPGEVNYLSVIASTPKKQVKRNPYNQEGPVVLGYRGLNPRTPERQPIRGRSVENRGQTRRTRPRFEPSPPPIERQKRPGHPLNAPNQKRSKGGKRKTYRRRK